MAAGTGGSRPASTDRGTYRSGGQSDTFAHSTSAARSRSTVRLVSRTPARAAAAATIRILLSSSSGTGPPSTLGAKYRSWRSAAAWNVSACTPPRPAPPTPSPRSRPRISPAARAVKVTASS